MDTMWPPSLSPPCAEVLLAVGLATTLLTHLGLKLRPSLAQACLMRAPRPQWGAWGSLMCPLSMHHSGTGESSYVPHTSPSPAPAMSQVPSWADLGLSLALRAMQALCRLCTEAGASFQLSIP